VNQAVKWAARIAAALALMAATAAAQEPAVQGFPFTIPNEGLAAGTAPAELTRPPAPAGAGGFVQAKGDGFRLSQSGEPVRFWGTNLCFGGAFPAHDVADRMARRMASLGINCVRFHHMDSSGYPNGIWATPGWGDFAHTTLSPEALDRLDYLIAQLKKNGVYADLNLHVSRSYGVEDGFPPVGTGESVPSYGKGVDNFFPKCIEEQKRYATMLLRHVNPYTGTAYADEPAVAIAEISNEDGLLSEWAGGGLDRLPGPYVEELGRQWNAWLARRYASTDALRAAWAVGGTQGGDTNLLLGVKPALELIDVAKADMMEAAAPGGTVRTVVVRTADPVSWHVQCIWAPLTIRKGAAYVLRLEMRANRTAEVDANCMMNHEPWEHLGLTANVGVTTEWKDYELTFTASQDDAPAANGQGGARITLSGLSQPGLEVSFTEPSLKAASIGGLLPGEELGGAGVAWPERAKLPARTPAVRLDVVRFLRDTEEAYWKGMCDFLHKDLGAKIAVTGTAAGNTSPYVAAETVDFVDGHAYWQHPHFPGQPWDPNNWLVRQAAMVNEPAGSTVAGLAGTRVLGSPYTVTEYNHPAPNRYEAEGFPLVAAIGSLQQWDGVFSFDYSGSARDEADHFDGYFDIVGHSGKLAEQPACADLLIRRPLAGTRALAYGYLSPDQRLDAMSHGLWGLSAYAAGVDRLAWLQRLVGLSTQPALPDVDSAASGAIAWNVENGRGLMTYKGNGAAGLIGFGAGKTLSVGGISLMPGMTSLDGFSVVMVNKLGGGQFGDNGRYLITAVARCWNAGMVWNQAGDSVGTQWGTGPTLCEGVPVTLRVDARRPARLFPLNPDGTRGAGLNAMVSKDGVNTFAVGPEHRTLWYELVIGE
jgi:hypothetical protein